MNEMNENEKRAIEPENPAANPDPITGEHGSHPVGTGAGTTGGGIAGAAIGGAIGGPIGAAVGAVVGGVVGAYSGRGVAEAVNPTVENEYWQTNHAAQPWANEDAPFEHYAPAYRTGYEGVTKYAGKPYQEIEVNLASDYEKNQTNPAIPWDQAKPATKAAWDRLSGVTGARDSDRGIRGSI